jgi:archaellin
MIGGIDELIVVAIVVVAAVMLSAAVSAGRNEELIWRQKSYEMSRGVWPE